MELHSEPILGDAFGVALLAGLDGSPADRHYIERSDGYVNDILHAAYFTPEEEWPPVDRACLDRMGDRVLDIGAGAGRVSLAAQSRGFDVTALDVSPGALEVCKERGVADVFLGTVEDLLNSGVESRYDTFLMMGNNIGLLGGATHSATVFGQLARLGNPSARIVGTVGNIYRTDNPDHLRYHDLNRSLARMAGELRLRIRYRHLTTEWFDYLFASPEELAGLATAAGWELVDVVEDEGFVYLAELRRSL